MFFTCFTWVDLSLGLHKGDLYGLIYFLHRQTMVQGMQEIDKLKMQMQDVQVPLEVFE